jgi:hypothetical protein
MNVDDQLDDLELELKNAVDSALIMGFNLDFWAEFDEPAPENLEELDRTIHHVFTDIIHRYRNTGVETILVMCRCVLKQVARAAINVPFPHSTMKHLETVADNLIRAYVDMFYADLRTEMVMLNHHAQVIQRNWKFVNTYPSHPVCRRRLLHEFEALGD